MKYTLSLVISLSTAFFVFGCGGASNESEKISSGLNEQVSGSGSGSTDGSGTPSGTPSGSTVSPAQLEVLNLTNAYRATNGLPPLAFNEHLSAAAQAYAELMAAQAWFNHNSPDGTTPAQRITQAGYDWRTWGENIAYGYSTPSAVMNGWINSSGHRANILGSSFKNIGVGYAVAPKSGTAYWVQDFGAID